MKGIDVSENNGYVDFHEVKAAGYDFVIVRCSYGKSGRDEMFIDNVNRAHEAGLMVGAYHYDYSLDTDDALMNTLNCKSAINESGVLLELPVFFDMEDADGYKKRNGFSFDPELVTAICKVFCDNIGLNHGIYASESWFNSRIDWRSLGCAVWNASWYGTAPNEPNPNDDTDGIKGFLWQYTDSAEIGGKYYDADWMYE